MFINMPFLNVFMLKKLKDLYENKYKTLVLIPFIILLLAFIQIGVQYSLTGDFVHKGISLKGGSTISFNYDSSMDLNGLEEFLKKSFPQAEITVQTLSAAGKIRSVAVDVDLQEKTEIDMFHTALAKHVGLPKTAFSVETIGSSLGQSFFMQTMVSLLLAFVLMGIVVFLYFRAIGPSAAVILAAFSGIVVTLAIFNLTGQKLTTAGVAGFLMLIGYSVDTDILLSSRVLKRHDGTVVERIYGAMKTGLTMTVTAIVAVLVALIFVQSEVIQQIMLILLIGLIVDIIMTWIQNAAILRYYVERKGLK